MLFDAARRISRLLRRVPENRTFVEDDRLCDDETPTVLADDCRRVYPRISDFARVSLTIFGPDGEELAGGTAVLDDYSPEGARLSRVRFDTQRVRALNAGMIVLFRVTGGQLAGMEVHGKIVRVLADELSMAVRFDCFYIEIDP